MKCYSLEEAKSIVLKDILKLDPSLPIEQRPMIIDSSTRIESFGWVFIYNSEAYITTQNSRYRWGGPGPILFNKFTGEIQRFNATYEAALVAQDYEKKLEAGNGFWVVSIRDINDKKLVLLRLKNLLKLSLKDLAEMSEILPGPIFRGEWRDVKLFEETLVNHGIPARTEVIEKSERALSTLKYDGKWIVSK